MVDLRNLKIKGIENMDNRIVITGGSGFIGSSLLEHFENSGENVIGTYHKVNSINSESLVQIDLTNISEVTNFFKEGDIVIHFGAVCQGALTYNPYADNTLNMIMNSVVLQAAYDKKVSHVIYPSCSVIYSSSSKPRKEEDYVPDCPLYPHYKLGAKVKIFAETLCESFAKMSDTKFTVMRHSNIYGPRDKFDKRAHVCAALIARVYNTPDGGPIQIHSSGKEERDLLYIDDFVNFIQLAIDKQKDPFSLLNVGYGESISINSLCELIISISGKKLQIQNKQDNSEPNKLSLDSSKARDALGWIPFVNLQEGLLRTYRWYAENCT
jgi:GDP-L-fucose synthase